MLFSRAGVKRCQASTAITTRSAAMMRKSSFRPVGAFERLRGRHFVGALEPFGRPLKDPRHDHGHGKTEQERNNHPADRPGRNAEEGKNSRRDLDQEPGDDTVSRGCAVDVASLELIENIARIHGCFPSHNS